MGFPCVRCRPGNSINSCVIYIIMPPEGLLTAVDVPRLRAQQTSPSAKRLSGLGMQNSLNIVQACKAYVIRTEVALCQNPLGMVVFAMVHDCTCQNLDWMAGRPSWSRTSNRVDTSASTVATVALLDHWRRTQAPRSSPPYSPPFALWVARFGGQTAKVVVAAS